MNLNRRYYQKSELPQALRELNDRPVVIFDLETNGLSNRNSVLSCTAFKFCVDGRATDTNETQPKEHSLPFDFPASGPLKLVDHFERYYFPLEQENYNAIRINGLSTEVIKKKRGNREWPPYFSEDTEFINFLKDAGLFIAHNIDFDAQFVPFLYDKPLFCTMKSNSFGKYPKLSELARRFKIEVDAHQLHGSSYDTYITALIFNKMVEEALPDSKQNEMFF